MTDKVLEREMAKAFLSCKFEADEEAEVWILEALTSLATKQEPENEKSRVMVQELVKTLTSKEISASSPYCQKRGISMATRLMSPCHPLKG